MKRRSFLQSNLVSTAILASSGYVHKASAENTPTINDGDPTMVDVDVLVVGGGSAGHVAAI